MLKVLKSLPNFIGVRVEVLVSSVDGDYKIAIG